MLDLGLTATERAAYRAALTTSHAMRVTLTIRDRDEKPISALTAQANKLISGGVQIDSKADVSRSLSLSLLDPTKALRFESNSPARGAVYADNFLSAEYGVLVDDEWVDVPVFWGPLTAFERSGAEVTVEAQGKEALMLAPHFATLGYTVHKRTRLDDAIERVARRTGERRFAIPKLPFRLKSSRPVRPESEPWKVLQGGEENAHGNDIPGLVERGPGDYDVRYNGLGELVVKKKKRSSSFTFDSSHLLEQPLLRYDIAEFRNTVVVHGGKRKKEPRAHARVSLDAHHPLSPVKLGRHGEKRYMTEFIEAEGLKTDRECRERANEVLERVSRQGLEPSFACLPIPDLEEDDRVTLDFDGYKLEFPIHSMTIPLTSEESMSVGTMRRIRVRKRKRV